MLFLRGNFAFFSFDFMFGKRIFGAFFWQRMATKLCHSAIVFSILCVRLCVRFSGDYFFSDVTQLMNVTLLYGWSTIQFRWNVSRLSENIIKNEQNHRYRYRYSRKSDEKEKEEEEGDVWSVCPRLTKLTCAPIASCTYFLLKYLRFQFFCSVFTVCGLNALHTDLRTMCTK